MTLRFRDLYERVVSAEGSTRPVALVRIGLVFIWWSRAADYFSPWVNHDVDRLILGAAFFIATLFALFGLWTQLALSVLSVVALVFLYRNGVQQQEAWIPHFHIRLLVSATIFLALTPCGGSYSLDRWRALARAGRLGLSIPQERGPLWATVLLRLQVSLVYFWGAFDKTNVAFLSGARLQQILLASYGTTDAPTSPFFAVLIGLAGTGTCLLEYALAFGLWTRRWRKLLCIVGVVFHGMLYVLLPIHTFSVTIVLLFLLFFPPDEVHQAIERISGHG